MRSPFGSPFRPSEIELSVAVPLTGTFRRTENEVAAACLILACRAYYDAFVPVTSREVNLALLAFDHQYSWIRNPFARPDFYGLVRLGAAEWVGPESEEVSRPLQFTFEGRLMLRESGWTKR